MVAAAHVSTSRDAPAEEVPNHDPEDVLKALLKVDPDAPPATPGKKGKPKQGTPLKDQGDPLSDK